MPKSILKILFIAIIIHTASAQDKIYLSSYNILTKNSSDIYKIANSDSSTNKFLTSSKTDPDNIDVSLFRSINNSRTKFKDAVLPLFDRSGPPMGFVLPITTLIYGRVSKNYYDENTGYLLGIAEGLNLCLTFGTKFVVKRKRPYASLKNVNHKETIRTDPYSFPSGHTSISFAMAVMYNLRYPKYPQVYAPMYIFSLIVAYGRPYFGMHYPSDLLGGAIVGAGSAALIYSLRNHLFKFKNNLLSENKEDIGSINGNNAVIFGGALVVSSIIGQFVLHSNKVNLNFSPYGKNNEVINLNLKVNF